MNVVTSILRGAAAQADRWSCEQGPVATRRTRIAAACRCAARALSVGCDARLVKLLEAGRAFAARGGPLAAVESSLREAERVAAEAEATARADVWGLFEGLRAADAAAQARAAGRVAAAFRWALGAGEPPPELTEGWGQADPLSDSPPAPACDPAWRTPDVLALARAAQGGETDALPILADALQEAGCDDERILRHCRDVGPHSPDCWVPDIILDGE
jgi:hypothetical protein